MALAFFGLGSWGLGILTNLIKLPNNHKPTTTNQPPSTIPNVKETLKPTPSLL